MNNFLLCSILLVTLVSLGISFYFLSKQIHYKNIRATLVKRKYLPSHEYVLVTRCLFCNEIFKVSNLDIHIKRSKRKNDNLYFVCPKCHEKVRISSLSFNELGYFRDFIGFIFKKDEISLDDIIYTVKPSLFSNNIIQFKFSDVFDAETANPYIIQTDKNKEKYVYLTKNNVSTSVKNSNR